MKIQIRMLSSTSNPVYGIQFFDAETGEKICNVEACDLRIDNKHAQTLQITQGGVTGPPLTGYLDQRGFCFSDAK